MNLRLGILALAALAGFASTAYGQTNYEQQRRLRTALDTCLPNETMDGAYCVRRCESGFKAVTSEGRTRCLATKAGAKLPSPEMDFKPLNVGPNSGKPDPKGLG
jgi:hypothetical protein